MDTTNSIQTSSIVEQPKDDEWDANGFEIPCPKMENPGTFVGLCYAATISDYSLPTH